MKYIVIKDQYKYYITFVYFNKNYLIFNVLIYILYENKIIEALTICLYDYVNVIFMYTVLTIT